MPRKNGKRLLAVCPDCSAHLLITTRVQKVAPSTRQRIIAGKKRTVARGR